MLLGSLFEEDLFYKIYLMKFGTKFLGSFKKGKTFLGPKAESERE